MKIFIYIVFILCGVHTSVAQEKILLWPQGKMPNSKGVIVSDTSAFVVCHRMPASPDLEVPEIAPWQDIQRAMRIICANAAKWGIDSNRIGVFGGSAGGHGASTLATHKEDISAIGDELDCFSYTPAFMILLSPVISFESPVVHAGSRDRLLRDNSSEELIEFFPMKNM